MVLYCITACRIIYLAYSLELKPRVAAEDKNQPSPRTGEMESQLKEANQPADDPNEVDWDGPDDPHNPRNWPVWKRGIIIGIVTSIVFST